MLLNGEIPASEAEIRPEVQHLGFQTVELVSLAVFPGDATSEMLLRTQLTAGFGDIYIADSAAMALLEEFNACLPLEGGVSRPLPGGLQIAAAANGTTTRSAADALEILMEKWSEKE